MLGESDLARWSVTLAWAALTGIGIPWIGMRALMSALVTSGRTVTNYRGREVHPGLGLVWVFWLLGVALFFAGTALVASIADMPMLLLAGAPLDLALVLVGGAFVFGLIDDAYGSGDEKGFRGHVLALVHGRLTTGGLKLLGIGLLSLLGGMQILFDSPLSLAAVVHAVAVAAVLALSANTLNLFDLRPGRALKVYVVLAALALATLVIAGLRSGATTGDVLGNSALLALFCVGPLLAVYRFDVGEIGILGDAGANGLGMWAGLLLVTALPAAGAIVLAVVLSGLNLASERVSFSVVIEGNRVFAAIDGWGRAPVAESQGESTE